ncbi:MAG TPA: hypothetical protein DEW46_06795 [Verrucomicrobia bacterium]|jgi:large-conductance mechanosensitive channel|nr:hypothetical protein [Verrucomicrobiota bacterium]
MFLFLLFTLLAVAVLLTSAVVVAFRKPIQGIFSRLIGEPLSDAWVRFLTFALYVVGISSAVHAYRLDQYVSTQHGGDVIAELNVNTWVLEIYQTVRSVLGGLAWSLMSFFIIALIAFIIVRACELKRERS